MEEEKCEKKEVEEDLDGKEETEIEKRMEEKVRAER